jgi:hypothetical protein
MGRNANLTSTEVLRALKVALQQFEFEANAALTTLEMEGRRPIEWIEQDRSRYWPREVRKASDAVSEARIALNRCELAITPEDKRSCIDERKALGKAKARMRLCEQKVIAVQRWRVQVKKEAEALLVHVSKLQRFLELDLSQATAALERMATALEAYVQRTPTNPAVEPESEP